MSTPEIYRYDGENPPVKVGGVLETVPAFEPISYSDFMALPQEQRENGSYLVTNMPSLMNAYSVGYKENISVGQRLDMIYGEIVDCSTARNVAAKTVALPGFSLQKNARVIVRFTNTGTSNPASGNLTLNVNNTGAKNIIDGHSNNATMTYANAGYFYNNQVCEFIYNGTAWVWLNRDNNSTYTGGTLKTAAAKTGSGSTVTNTIAANTTMDNAIGTLLNNDYVISSITTPTWTIASGWSPSILDLCSVGKIVTIRIMYNVNIVSEHIRVWTHIGTISKHPINDIYCEPYNGGTGTISTTFLARIDTDGKVYFWATATGSNVIALFQATYICSN